MRIGILTYHRSNNYGALLQGVALRYVLQEMGHDAYFIDYWPNYHYEMYALFPPKLIIRNVLGLHARYLWRLVRDCSRRWKRIKHFRKFISENVRPYMAKYSKKEEFDVIIYGSDQIWRKQGGLGGKFNPVYFGENILTTKNHVSYAASMGIIDLSDEDKSFLKSSLSRFSKISVRESSLNDAIVSLGLKSEVVLDPTLLLDSHQWDKLLSTDERPINEKYVLFYQIMGKSFDEDKIKAFAAERGLRYVKLAGGVSKKQAGVLDNESPETFVSLVKHADFVFTSSFHGLAFSIIYNKQFFASYSANAGRAESLLNSLCLSNRLLEPMSALPSNVERINYEDANTRMASLRKSSIDFLKAI